MTSSVQYKDLSEFLVKHNAKQDKNNGTPTHTRIGDKNLNIYGGSYVIPKEELPTFYALYYDYVFVKKKMEYLTEKQQDENGPLLVDFDFRYDYDIETRQHTKEHIQDMISLYLDELKEIFVFEEKRPFPVFIMEKPNVNRLSDGSITKDGIHMIIGIQMDHILQMMLRDKIIEKIQDVWELPLKNGWDSVLDEGISKGTTNWQLYGSRKPANDAYELTRYFIIEYDKSDGEFMMVEHNIREFDLSKDFMKISVQYDKNEKFELNPKILDEYNRKLQNKNLKPKKTISKTKIRLLEEEEDEDNMSLDEIDNSEKLKKAMENILKNLKPNELYIKETHEYTQILPKKYYEPGSHLLNRQVAFALKHTDDRLFLSWIMLRSKAEDFDYSTITDLYNKWKKHFNVTKNSRESDFDGVTRKSIMYWAKQDAYEDFIKVKNSTIDHFIEETISTPTEFDFAMVLYHMFKDKYVCASITNKNWYVFKNHRWEQDQGQSLRLAISKVMYETYQEKTNACVNEMQHYDSTDDRAEYLKKKIRTISEISVRLKKTNDKNNIMREAMELFYDKDFVKNMDANRYLLCFTNGVVDFKSKTFRDGYPQDYITKTTGIPYMEFNENDNHIKNTSENILSFMEQLFPVPELNKYMWNHLASCLIGTNMNQTFNIYRGSGSNGKSILTDLMTHTLGEYKGTVPITLVTEKRNGIGGTSSEVIQLKGVRYAVMQEPSKDARINEGVMKELTGGDPIQARALYSESEIFIPQFKLVVCTNALFEINSNDDGTWRRIRICDFMSKFVGENEIHTDNTHYVFPKDKNLNEKLPKWAPIFASMLVKIAFETNGFVDDCDIVLKSSNKYRQGQDHIAAFIDEMVLKTGNPGDKIKKGEITNEFKLWFQNSQGNRKIPKGIELYEYMEKKFGKCKTTGWHGVKIAYPENLDEVNEMDE
jgi:P4 family phage/plasmid primase-like protien